MLFTRITFTYPYPDFKKSPLFSIENAAINKLTLSLENTPLKNRAIFFENYNLACAELMDLAENGYFFDLEEYAFLFFKNFNFAFKQITSYISTQNDGSSGQKKELINNYLLELNEHGNQITNSLRELCSIASKPIHYKKSLAAIIFSHTKTDLRKAIAVKNILNTQNELMCFFSYILPKLLQELN